MPSSCWLRCATAVVGGLLHTACQPGGPTLHKVVEDLPEMREVPEVEVLPGAPEVRALPLPSSRAPRIEPFVGAVLERATGSSVALALDLGPSPAAGSGHLSDADRLGVVRYLRQSPLGLRSFDAAVIEAADDASDSGAPIARLIDHAALVLGAAEAPSTTIDLPLSMNALCGGSCAAPEGELPADLAVALQPIFSAAAKVIEARDARTADVHGAQWWVRNRAAAIVAKDYPRPPNPADPSDRAYLLYGRARLYSAAAALAEAIEEADLGRFRGRRNVHYRLVTPHGVIAVEDAADHRYWATDIEWLFLLDLGGDDLYLDRIAANRSALNAVSVAIDLDGDDLYGYPEVQARQPDSPEHLPADPDGRGDRFGIYEGASLSEAGRQASAANGVAMLFDLRGDDRYFALQGAQGFADQGVAVLFDGAGDDEYVLEALGQGAASSGIGLLYDRAGDDHYQAITRAQGFGFVAGLGLLYEGEGDDRYDCAPGSRIYPAPQDEGLSASFCQGAGFGLRVGEATQSLAGGVGLLRDRTGHDEYRAGAFGQGVGYWEGLGILAEGGGDDHLDVRWYGAGAGVHYGLGLYLDAAGDDELGQEDLPLNMILGAGHDYGLGIALDQSGDDDRRLPSMSAGAGSASGLGIFMDARGDDRLRGSASTILGAAVADESLGGPTTGLYLDAGGDDRYPGERRDGEEWSGRVVGEGAGAAGADGEASLGPDLSLRARP